MVQESQSGAVDMGRWKALFEWSMKYQDGPQPSSGVQPMSPERRQWLENALKEGMQDFVARMKQIKGALDAAGTMGEDENILHEQEQMLDELQEIVESVDHARDLHTIGGLPTLLLLLSSPQPSLRWRAAEVVATCAANNPPVQRWFMEGGALPPLIAMLGDNHPTAVTKALLALSAMMRHYDQALEAFRLADGLHKLTGLLPQPAGSSSSSQDEQRQQQQARQLRKGLGLLSYVLSKHPADCTAAAQLGVPERLAALLQPGSAWPADIQLGSLGVLLELAQHPDAWGSLRDTPQLQQAAGALAEGHGGDDSEAGEVVALAQRLQHVLAGPCPQAVREPFRDHIEVDPQRDGPAGSRDPQTLTVNASATAAGSGEAGATQQAVGNGTASSVAAPLALAAP